MKTLAFDRFSLAPEKSVRSYDDNGFLHVSVSPVTREQVAPYRGREVPDYDLHGLDADKIYYGYRPAEELSAPETIESLNGIPIQFEHHIDFADNPATDTRVGSTGTDAKFESPYLTNSLHFQDDKAIKRIEDGSMKELSLGYSYVPIFKTGVFENRSFDFIMTKIRCNHVALVEEGRAGHRVCVGDSNQEIKMEEKKDDLQTTADVKEVFTWDGVLKKLQDAGLDLARYDGDLKADMTAVTVVEKIEDLEAEDDDEEEVKTEEVKAEDEEEVKTEEVKTEEVKTEEVKAEDEEEVKTEEDKGLTDEERAEIIKRVKQEIESKYDAIDECEQSLGKIKPSAFDSAGDVFKAALKAEGYNVKNISNSAARDVYQALMCGKSKSANKIIAQDSKSVKTSGLSSIMNNIGRGF